MSELNQNLPKPGRGGAREGAGRPKGSRDRVTVQGILEALEKKTLGQTYEDLLIEDFLIARLSNDSALIHKYHTLLSSKFVANLTDIKVESIGDETQTKQTAFLEALKQLNSINTPKDDQEDAPD
jgi:hypothetical protein